MSTTSTTTWQYIIPKRATTYNKLLILLFFVYCSTFIFVGNLNLALLVIFINKTHESKRPQNIVSNSDKTHLRLIK